MRYETALRGLGIASLIWLATTPVSAQCSEGLVGRLIDLDHNGSEGFWIPTVDAECLLLRLESIPGLESHVRLLEERIAISDLRHDTLTESARLAAQQIETYERALANAMADLVALDDWWKSPWLWFPVGLVVGASAVIAGALAL
jgi:hypothetical protein